MIEDDKYVIKGLPPLVPIPNVSVGKLIYDQLVANCVEDEALVDAMTGQLISYKELLSKTCSLAESLRRSGYGINSMITISSENCVEFFTPIIAALYIGAAVAPVNPNYTKSEMLHALNITKPQIIFCSKQESPKFVDLRKRLTFIEKIIIIDNEIKSNGLESVQSFINKTLNARELCRFDLADVENDKQIAFILYSSGTTGLPKGVMITHKNVLTKLVNYDDPRVFPQEKGRSTLGLLPFFHASGLFGTLGSIYKSVKTIVLKKFEEKLFLSCIEKYKITGLSLVPSLAVLLVKSPLVHAYDLSSLKYVAIRAAPMSKDVEELLKKRLKVDAIRQVYGLIETTGAVTGIPHTDERNGSCGKVYPYMLCKIRDPETGRSLGPNQVGEICVKGALVMKGYYGNKEATRNSFTSDGWFLTGDLAYYDKEEYFYIVGRLKELIKYKGLQVAPAELEALLLTNPKIKDAAVIGVPDEEAGELPLAFVVRYPNSDLTEREVQEFVAEKMSSQKRLRGGVIFILEIPKNASGKILRKKIKELLPGNKSKL